MRAAGYIRVSTEEQAEHGHSLDAQRTAIADFVCARGWELVEEYVDAGLSGRSDRRPALRRLLDDATNDCFDVVIVHAIDRFYRDLQGLLSALDHLRRYQVAFISITENLDFTSPWGKLALAVLGTLAEIYLDRLSAETSKGKKARAQKGLWNGSIPLGYCKGLCSACTDPNGPGYCPYVGGPNRGDGVVLVPHPIESVAVHLAYTWYATGKYSDGDIAQMLNEYEHELPDGTIVHFRSKRLPERGGPGPFCKDSVRSILTRPFYTGVVPYYGVTPEGRKRKKPVALYPGRHEPLISQELFDRCQEIRQLTYRFPRRREGKATRVYYLSGILFCAQCRGKMRAQASSGGRRYYACVTRLQRRGSCDQPMVPAEEIETQVVDFLSSLPIPLDWESWLMRILRPGEDLEEMRKQEAAVRERLARAKELYLAGDIDKERYEKEKLACHRALADLRPKEITDIIAAVQMLKDFEQRWAAASDLEKKKLLRGAVAAAFIRGHALVAVQPQEQLYPLLHCFYYGSDGNSSTSYDVPVYQLLSPTYPLP